MAGSTEPAIRRRCGPWAGHWADSWAGPGPAGPVLGLFLGLLLNGLVLGLSVVAGSLLSVGFIGLVSIFGWLPTLVGTSSVGALVGIPAWHRRRRRLQKEQEHQELVEGVHELIGNSQLAQGFLDALEELTRYVPEKSEALLCALRDDLREYRILEAYIASSKNEVVVRQYFRRKKAIQEAVRILSAQLTQEALETLRSEQNKEAEQVIEEEPHLVAATQDFSYFLEGMREAREAIAPLEQKKEEAEKVQPLLPPTRKRSS